MKFGNFNREEFECKCGCGFAAVDVELLQVLNLLRDFYNKPVTLNSACRCERHNKHVGGTLGSKHVRGLAADIVVRDVSPRAVYDYLETMYPDTYGIGLYGTFVHLDVRKKKARW